MTPLFTRVIDGWDAWSRVYCDVAAFEPLVRAIYAREGLSAPEAVENTTPGTNAVFRCGDTVIKLFAPEASGFDPAHDFAVESAMLRFAQKNSIPASDLLRIGRVEDAYTFRYLIMRFVEGEEAGNALQSLSVEDKRRFAASMRGLLDRLHQPERDLLPPVDLKARALDNFRLLTLPERLTRDIRARIKALCWTDEVLVHGDITGENVLLDTGGKPVLIDFADSVLAPVWYEWPALVFELFRSDRELTRAFIGNTPVPLFVNALLDGLALHDFGANIIAEYAAREALPLEAIPTLESLAARLTQTFS